MGSPTLSFRSAGVAGFTEGTGSLRDFSHKLQTILPILKLEPYRHKSLVEAAGVEPASEIARDEKTTCVA
jgi:hypothetical protein